LSLAARLIVLLVTPMNADYARANGSGGVPVSFWLGVTMVADHIALPAFSTAIKEPILDLLEPGIYYEVTAL